MGTIERLSGSARRLAAVVLAAIIALGAALGPAPQPAAQAAPAAITGLRVSGNKLVNASGQVVRLRGVNRSGTEYACIQGWGIFDGPSDAASVRSIASWGINAVRLPLNEQCWLGINTNSAYGGANYQSAVRNYVNLLNSNGIVAILDLHWSAPRSRRAEGQAPMPDRELSPAFWRQVATAYRGNSSVIFDLFNEPIPDNNQNTTEAWRCWKNGGACAGIDFTVAGMQELVNAVRGTGATNPIMLTGIQYGAGLTRWLEYKPSDPRNGLMASWHMYPMSWYADDANHWNTYVAPVASRVPLIAGEIGQTNGYCGTEFLDRVADWLDARGASYNAWTWNAWGGCEALIEDYSGTPTQPYGQAYKSRLARGTNAAPAVSTPTQGAATGYRMETATVPMRIAWGASDADGISGYRVQRSANGGPYYTVSLPSPTTRSIVQQLRGGDSYRYRVSAVDRGGLASGWKYGATFRPERRDDASDAWTWTSGWRTNRSAYYYKGSARLASTSGPRATTTVSGRGIALVAAVGPNSGKAEVWLDGTRVATVDLYASRAGYRRVVFSRTISTSQAHTLQIRPTGTKNPNANRAYVIVDAAVMTK